MGIANEVRSVGNKSYELYLDMPSKVFIEEEVEMKDILRFITKFIVNEEWNINAVGICTINEKFYMKLIIISLLVLQIILIMSKAIIKL